MERFELSRRLPDLPHFECGPFSHLGTSPDSGDLERLGLPDTNNVIIYEIPEKVNHIFYCIPKNLSTPSARPVPRVSRVAAEWSEALSPNSISIDGTVE